MNNITGRTHVGDIGGRETDVGHDGDHHMFLHVELSGIETPGVSEGIEFTRWEDLLQQFTGREGATYKYPLVIFRMGLKRTERTAAGQHWHQC